MELHLPYLLRVAIAITTFYMAYFLLFRKEKVFLFNRYYLIISMLLSFIIPLITFTKQIAAPEVVIPIQTDQIFSNVQSTSALPASIQSASSKPAFIPAIYHYLNRQLILEILFLSGFVFFGVTLIIGHLKALLIVKKSSKISLNGYPAWVTQKDVPPFTYFGRLIIPSGILNSPHLQSVASHEQIHAKGNHCIDLCIAEILFLFQWFNPFAWLMKYAVRDNLEYLADDKVVGSVNQQEYQLSMISLASKNTFYTFPSISNQSQLKKRIIMMKKGKTNRFQWIRSLVIIPILTILTVTLSGREIQIIYPEPKVTEIVQTIDNKEADPVENSHIQVTEAVETNIEVVEVIEPADKDTNSIREITKVKENHMIDKDINQTDTIVVSQNNTFMPDSTYERIDFNELIYGNDSTVFIVDGQQHTSVESKLISLCSNDIENMSMRKRIRIANGEEKTELIIYITTKNNANNTVIQNVESVSQTENKPIIFMDGKEVSSSSELNNLDPKIIESISILKDKNAIDLYGEKAKNGVIIIKTKNADTSNQRVYNQRVYISGRYTTPN